MPLVPQHRRAWCLRGIFWVSSPFLHPSFVEVHLRSWHSLCIFFYTISIFYLNLLILSLLFSSLSSLFHLQLIYFPLPCLLPPFSFCTSAHLANRMRQTECLQCPSLPSPLNKSFCGRAGNEEWPRGPLGPCSKDREHVRVSEDALMESDEG